MFQSIASGGWWVGLCVFALTFFAHVALWYFFPMLRRIPVLFALFFLSLLLLYVFHADAPTRLLYSLLALNYISVYPAFQASSPTLVILDRLYQQPRGMTEREIQMLFNSNSLVQDRMNDLISGGLISTDNQRTQLSWMGKSMAFFFIAYRRVLGLPVGEG